MKQQMHITYETTWVAEKTKKLQNLGIWFVGSQLIIFF